MASLNRVLLAGNLTRPPEVRYLPQGGRPVAVADLSLAVGRKYRTSSGEERGDTCFANVVVWGAQAEAAGKYLTKGSPVLVEGSLRYEEWKAKGETHHRLRVQAERLQFLDFGRRSGTSAGGGAGGAPAPPRVGPERDEDNLS